MAAPTQLDMTFHIILVPMIILSEPLCLTIQVLERESGSLCSAYILVPFNRYPLLVNLAVTEGKKGG